MRWRLVGDASARSDVEFIGSVGWSAGFDFEIGCGANHRGIIAGKLGSGEEEGFFV